MESCVNYQDSFIFRYDTYSKLGNQRTLLLHELVAKFEASLELFFYCYHKMRLRT
jgi:hypothetical protein